MRPSSMRWTDWGMVWNGRCLTAKISASPNPAKGCTLSDILMKDAGEKYFLSPKQQERLLCKSARSPGRTRLLPGRGELHPDSSGAGGFGGNTGLYAQGLPIRSDTKAGYQTAYPGDSVRLSYPTTDKKRGRVGTQIAHTLTTSADQGVLCCVDLNENPEFTGYSRCLTAKQKQRDPYSQEGSVRRMGRGAHPPLDAAGMSAIAGLDGRSDRPCSSNSVGRAAVQAGGQRRDGQRGGGHRETPCRLPPGGDGNRLTCGISSSGARSR